MPASQTPPEFAIEARGLDKTYRAQGKGAAVHALKAIDLAIPRGSFFGLLGPNGAGKSTFINILGGLVVKSGGAASIWGHDIDADPMNARGAIGIVPQELNMDPFFSPAEALEIQAGYYGVPKGERRTEEILRAVGLWDKRDAYARTLSGGMKRRLLVAKAMVHGPPVLVLDEPTAGVDVELRQTLWAFIRRLNEAGHTIVLTTHYLEEAESLCGRIAMLQSGRVVALDTTAKLLRRFSTHTLRLRSRGEMPADLVRGAAQSGGWWSLPFDDFEEVEPLLARIRAAGCRIDDLEIGKPDLEEVFIRVMQGQAETPAN